MSCVNPVVPHNDVIEKDSTIVIPSIFLFEGGAKECYPFLKKCEDNNCTVYFKNEDFTIYPDGQDTIASMKLIIYLTIAERRAFGNDFIRYLGNMEKMTWGAVRVQ